MYKYSILLFGFIFYFSLSQGQNLNYKGKIYDIETKEYIQFATVHISNTLKYKDADQKGFFEIEAKNTDSLIVTSIGYNALKIPISQIVLGDSLFLKRQVIKLPEIVISKPEIKTFGIVEEKSGESCSGGSEASRYEIATLIEIPDTLKLFKISKIFIKGKDFKDENPVRLHIYDVDSNGLPGNELLTKEIIITNSDREGKKIIIDIKNQSIFLEGKSFFVSIQWLTSTKVKIFTGPEIFETFKISRLLTYRRSLAIKNNQWYGLFKWDMVFYPQETHPNNETPINVQASAEIEVYAN